MTLPRLLPGTQAGDKSKMTSTRSRAKVSKAGSIPSSDTSLEAPSETPSFMTDESSSKTRGKAKAIAPSDPQFAKVARTHGVLSIIESVQPNNFLEVRSMLDEPRTSPSPNDLEFKNFSWKIEASHNEGGVQHTVMSMLVNDYQEQPHYVQIINAQFTRCPGKLTTKPQPDLVEGYTESTFQNFPLQELRSSAVPIYGSYVPALAHFVGEFKKFGGDFRCGQVQAGYDAAYLVDGRDQAATLMERADEPGKAYVGSFVCDGERLQLFLHYSSTDRTGQTVFHQVLVRDDNLRENHQAYVNARRRIRNFQDWTKENAKKMRDYIASSTQRPRSLKTLS